MSLSELRAKDVVNTLDGKRLGKVMDLEFDPCTGCVEALVVPGEFKVSHALRGEKCGGKHFKSQANTPRVQITEARKSNLP